jgi:2-hydroxychromene-2-carboxylate isomerase
VSSTQPLFFYNLGDPRCYLAAEQIAAAALPVMPEWEPVLWPSEKLSAHERREIEQLARQLELQPVRWPAPWPPDTRVAMLAAAYAKSIGRAVAFSLAAFRQAFAGGRDLGSQDTVLIAGAACEMHPKALLRGVALGSVEQALERATLRARTAGVGQLPAIAWNGTVRQGPDALTR